MTHEKTSKTILKDIRSEALDLLAGLTGHRSLNIGDSMVISQANGINTIQLGPPKKGERAQGATAVSLIDSQRPSQLNFYHDTSGRPVFFNHGTTAVTIESPLTNDQIPTGKLTLQKDEWATLPSPGPRPYFVTWNDGRVDVVLKFERVSGSTETKPITQMTYFRQ